MAYPQNSYFEIRQFIDSDLLAAEISHANTPDVRAVDRMFGEEYDHGPGIMFDFKEVNLQVIAKNGKLSHEFQMPLYSHSVEVVI